MKFYHFLITLFLVPFLINCSKNTDETPVSKTSGTWQDKNNFLGDKRHHPISFSIGQYGYVGLGSNPATIFNDFYRYDPSNDTWKKLNNFAGGARSFVYGVSHNGKGYVGFGNDVSKVYNDLWEYNPTADTWRQLKSCPCDARQHPAMIALNGNIYIGAGNSTKNLKDWWEYNIATNTWTQKTDIPGAARHHPFYFGIDKMAYVGFGHGSEAVNGQIIYNDLYQYNTTTSSWKKMKDFPSVGRVAGTQFDYNGNGYILSGQGADHLNLAKGELWEYNSKTDGWKQLAPHRGSGRWAPGSFVIGNKMFFMGGTSNIGDEKDLQVYEF